MRGPLLTAAMQATQPRRRRQPTPPEISHGFVWNRATRRALQFKHDMVDGVNKLRQH